MHCYGREERRECTVVYTDKKCKQIFFLRFASTVQYILQSTCTRTLKSAFVKYGEILQFFLLSVHTTINFSTIKCPICAFLCGGGSGVEGERGVA